MARFTTDFKIGDEVRVLGDDRGFGHSWPPGTIVVLERYDSSDHSWYGRPPTKPGDDQLSGNWVSETEIEPMIPTEELDKQAAQLFGVALPANHCPTCTCRA